jgi:small-conductance mechanosensitive channel
MMLFLQYLHDALALKLFNVGGAPFTAGHLVAALLALAALLLFSRWLQNWMLRRLLGRGHLSLDTRETAASLTRYLVLTVGVIVILDAVGIRLSSFTVLAGALGVGVGFGLQNIFSNFVSGLMVMFERPVKLGDHIVVSGVEGDVIAIGMRATTLRTAQGNNVIVPNQGFITGNVVNWSRDGTTAAVLQWRMQGAPAEDEALLLRVLGDNPRVLKAPAPSAYVISADHAGHVMEAHFHVSGDAQGRLRVCSDINRALLEALAKANQALAANP